MMIPSENISLKEWADSLRVDFNTTDIIPIVNEDTDWKEWGNIVASSPTFVKNSAPETDLFPNWVEWGIMIYGTMAR